MPREGPRSDDLDFLPRFAASAAPAAICCFFDLAGIAANNVHFLRGHNGAFTDPTIKRFELLNN